MTESTGTVKGYTLLKTKMFVQNITRNGANGATIVELRPEWDTNIREHQLAMENSGKRNATFSVEVPPDSGGGFRAGQTVPSRNYQSFRLTRSSRRGTARAGQTGACPVRKIAGGVVLKRAGKKIGAGLGGAGADVGF